MWNLGDVLDEVALAVSPAAPAFIHGDRVTYWPQAKARMEALACAMRAAGLATHDRVAFLLRNGPAYGEMAGACFLGALTHVNVNYRYKADELQYILDNADAAAIVYNCEFREIVDAVRKRVPTLRLLIEVGDTIPAGFAVPYEKFAGAITERQARLRSGEDLVFIYTGGTTGMPKGVVYHHKDLVPYLMASSGLFGDTLPQSVEDVGAMIRARGGAGARYLPACPQMHGTGLFVSLWTMATGGCVVTLDGPSFDAHALWRMVEKHAVTHIAIVGDPFARPMVRALEEPGRGYNLSSLQMIGSSGAMWSAECKDALLRHIPHISLLDVFSSTETNGMGVATCGAGAKAQPTATFTGGVDAILIDDNDRPIARGAGIPGRLAVGGMQPTGYHKDPEKTARTFKVIEGKRYSVPGDYALIAADGTVTLLGRGSHCINTAGEKVYPEEVEEVLKTHADIDDALVVGRPDATWGQIVIGVVRLRPGATLNETALREHVRARLANYKTPKRIVATTEVLRATNGKGDYKMATSILERQETAQAQ